MCLHSISRSRGSLRFIASIGLFGLLCLSASAQTSSNCNTAASTPSAVASTGLAEQIGNIVLTCSGGNVGSSVIAALYITLNTNVTNSLDTNGNPLNITVTGSGPATVSANPPALTSATTVAITNLTYVVPSPNSLPVTITISGIRAAVALVQNAQSGTVVNATFVGVGFFSLTPTQLPIALGTVPLLGSILNNGVNCNGSPLPPTTDFPTFVGTGTTSSAVRITEANTTAFTSLTQNPAATNGTRILVQLTGYPAGTQLWVPSALVGNSGSVPTSAGQFGSSIAGGTYTPNANQLLLTLISGADQNGVGGTFVTPLPSSGTSFTGMTQLTVSNGSAYAVYEVLDDSPYVEESVQVPVFIVNSQTNCNAPANATFSIMEAPLSTVSIATATDPIPRYIVGPLASDCQQTGDCNQNYFPVLSADTTPISFTGASLGLVQTAPLTLLNNGGSVMSYTTSTVYQSGANWLTITPSAADIPSSLTLTVSADPTLLQPGTYNATITVNAGEAGTASIPVTFTVGPPGVTIRAIVNAASFQTGIAPGSYVALYGQLLAGTNVGVTFNGLAATVIPVPAPYNQTQINLIIPSSLTPQSGALVVVTVDGKVSNTYSATLLANAPGIFTPGILNSDSLLNTASNPAKRGSFVQVYLTGLAIPVIGTVSVTMGGQTGIVPLYAGAQPTLPALDQINVTIPASLAFTGTSTPLAVCISTLPSTPAVCSNSVSLYVQ
jgi:uncharacterized protein (TIGR03437 family)